jgi:segregation and condensation protein B
MNGEQLKNILEAALMAADTPLAVGQLQALFEEDADRPDKTAIRQALEELAHDFEHRGVELREVASGFRFQVRSDYAPWVNRLQEEKPQRYSRALLETLAIIAYRQPVTRGEIEDIRGVSISSGIIRTLLEREWIRVVGHRDVPGKPELLATTRQFLDYFNLRKLSDLPPLSEIKDFDKINPDLFESLEPEQNEAAAAQESAADPEVETAAGEEAELFAEDNVVPFSGHS